MTNRQELLDRLNEISSNLEFLEILLIICDKNLNCRVDELQTRDLRKTLSENEIVFLFGLWLKNKNKGSYKINDKNELCKEVHNLMDKFHLTFISDFNYLNTIDSFYETTKNSPNAIKETIFYAGTGAYDFQFINFLSEKYELDKSWLKEHEKITTTQIQNLYIYIKTTLNFKLNVPKFRKDIVELYSFDRNNFVFKKNPEFITILDKLSFELDETLNENFNDIGELNYFRLRPVIRTENKFIIPFPYLLSETLYDSPFYWMLEDNNYKSLSLKHRGDSAENITKKILERKFGQKNVFVEVNVNKVKTETITDLDICVVYMNKMLIFQVKSKRLTQLSKNGDIEQFHKDFKLAVIEANNQAKISFPYILSNSCKLKSKITDDEIDCSKIDEIVSACIVLDNYPAITTHTRMFYFEESENIPVAISIFDLEVIIDYIKDFDMLFDYLKKREEFSKYYIADNEFSFFSMYLKNGLCKMEESDLVLIDNNFAQFFDSNYYYPLMEKYQRQLPTFIKGIGRNDFCFCGSGKKYKSCCLNLNDKNA